LWRKGVSIWRSAGEGVILSINNKIFGCDGNLVSLFSAQKYDIL
jgi:hypothetical protein